MPAIVSDPVDLLQQWDDTSKPGLDSDGNMLETPRSPLVSIVARTWQDKLPIGA